MKNSVRSNPYRGKDLRVSLIGAIILALLIGSILMFGPDAETPATDPVETTQITEVSTTVQTTISFVVSSSLVQTQYAIENK